MCRQSLFIVPRVDGTVSAFEASSGEALWHFSTGGPLVQTSTSPSPLPPEDSIEQPAFSPSPEVSIFQEQGDVFQVPAFYFTLVRLLMGDG